MGSLMAGWDSRVSGPKDGKLGRNKSLTKGEIETFWKSKKLKEEEHLRDISLLSPRSQLQGSIFEESNEGNETATSEPMNTKGDIKISTSTLDKLINKNGWWVSSNWAFLNEPPVLRPDGTAMRYASQFHVAGSTTHQGPTGINARCLGGQLPKNNVVM